MSVSSDLLKGLNKEQAAAVSAPPGPTLVVAGPGSGKTAVLTRRVAFLIREIGISPYKIMAVTFTNKAAKEMLTRTDKLLNGSVKGLSIGTFHSICARILRREAEFIGLKPSYVIYDTGDQLTMMKQAIEEARLDQDRNAARKQLSKISNAKNELIGPDEYPADNYEDRKTHDLYRRYQELMRLANALDFDDLLMQTVILFRKNPQVLEEYQRFYEHFLIDEFQDTNTAQYALVKMLASAKRNLFCVGDPDQSIYRFRGADYRNINNFQRDFPDVRIILLEQNYRSHQIILDAAMSIIDKNADRIRKELYTTRKEGPKIALKNLNNEEDEAKFIADTVLEIKYRGKYELKDCAIMYRTNAQSRSLEEMFGRVGIPYRLVGGTRFYDRREVKDVIAYLKVIHNPDDTISLDRIINVPARSIGKTTLTKLRQWTSEHYRSMYDGLRLIAEGSDSPFSGKTAKSLIEFYHLIESWRQIKDSQPVAAVLTDVLDKTQYRMSLLDGTPEGQERVDNVNEFLGRAFNAGDMRLTDFLEEVALVSDIDNYDENGKGLTMMTLHAAKGLEFPVVFIIGLEEGVLPHTWALQDEDQMDEERRLMYVGITRAKDVLHLTWASKRSLYGGMGERYPASRFLSEIPDKLVTGSPVPRRAVPNHEQPEYEWGANMRKWTPPTPAPRPQRPPSRASNYRSGQRVLHARFGEGVIIASKVRGDDEEIDIKFANHGVKRVYASVASLVLLEDD